jgi:hypothetical protein
MPGGRRSRTEKDLGLGLKIVERRTRYRKGILGGGQILKFFLRHSAQNRMLLRHRTCQEIRIPLLYDPSFYLLFFHRPRYNLKLSWGQGKN